MQSIAGRNFHIYESVANFTTAIENDFTSIFGYSRFILVFVSAILIWIIQLRISNIKWVYFFYIHIC